MANLSEEEKRMLEERMNVKYRARTSILDFSLAHENQFRGFFMLFWICLGAKVLDNFMVSFTRDGKILSLSLASLMTRDLLTLGLSDLVLVGQTLFCVPLVYLLYRSGMKMNPIVIMIQFVWYVTILVCVCVWVRIREWPWTQSGFFLLHAMVQIMKIHSYMDVNVPMQNVYVDLKKQEKSLAQKVLDVEGPLAHTEDLEVAWNMALEHTAKKLNISTSTDVNGQKDPFFKWGSLSMQTGPSKTRSQIWRRRIHAEIPRSRSPIPLHRHQVRALEESDNYTSKSPQDFSFAKEELRDTHPLMWHPHPDVANSAHQIARLREELYGEPIPEDQVGPMWPNNISFSDFVFFQLVPSLVYKLQYPRTMSIRWWFVAERCIAFAGIFLVVYTTIVTNIMPIVADDSLSLVSVFLKLMAPMIACYLLIFYLMFECVCQAFAEVTRFADREFYRDWWNSTNMAEFARDWNRPVHHFLLQHVYVSLIFKAGMSKNMASILTFLLSSILHELVMIIVSGKIRGYLFMMQMSQYPLIMIGRTQFIRSRPAFGNFLFWFGMIIGFPMLNILYLKF
ncbi:Sterol O-acyltransferase 2 (Sterol-ester synthase 2) [Malassezia pachydermatis]